MPLSRDLREFIECLNSNEVEYLIVGALAVSWHGFARYSADVDFLIRPSQANAVRVLRALSQFGFGSLDISASDLTSSGKVIQLGYEPNRIDLMTSVTGVSFDDAWDDRDTGDLDGLRVNFIGRSSLLRNKDATGRPKDRIDAEELRKQKPST
jgi:hypothetical protein